MKKIRIYNDQGFKLLKMLHTSKSKREILMNYETPDKLLSMKAKLYRNTKLLRIHCESKSGSSDLLLLAVVSFTLAIGYLF